MADVSKIKLGSTTYDVKDATARSNIDNLQTAINNIESITQTEIDEITDYTPDSFPAPVYGYDTIADMQADASLQEGMTCHTNGSATVGDGGAAWYTIDTTGTADGESVIACAGSLYAHKVTHAVPFSYSEHAFTGTNGNKALVHYAIIPSDYKPELVLSGGRVNQRQYEIDVANETQSFVLINAGIFNVSTGNTEGVVITDSTVRKNEATTLEDRSVLYMTADGALGTASSTLTGSQVLSTYHPVWAVTGFYPFVENGEFTGSGHDTTDYQPRSCIAQDASGNYLVFACSGRKYGNQGMSIADMYAFMSTVGFAAQFAYNLDGGASSSLTIMGVRTNDLTNDDHRSVANFIAFKNPKGNNTGLFQATKPAAQFILRNDREQTQLYSTQHFQFVTEGAAVSNQIVGIDKSSSDYVYTPRLTEAFDTASGLYRLLTRRPQDSSAVQAFALNSVDKIGMLYSNNIATQKIVNFLSWSARTTSGSTYTLESTSTSNLQKLVAVLQQDGKNFFCDFYFYNLGSFSTTHNSVATPSGDIVYIDLVFSGSQVTYTYTTPASGKLISLQRLVGVDHM